MNAYAKLAIAAAAVVVVAVAGIYFLPRGGNVAGPVPTASPSPTPSPVLNFVGSYAPGTTYTIDDPCCVGPSRMTFTMPATGWSAFDFVSVGKNVPGGSAITMTSSSARIWSGTSTPVAAIGLGRHSFHPSDRRSTTSRSRSNAQAGPDASPPTDVIVGGFPGKKVELSIPEDLDVATTCDSDGDFRVFGRWYQGAPYGAGPWTFGNGQHNTVYIVDVDGTRQVIDTMYVPGTSAADLAELDQIVKSIRFEPRPTPSPSS